MTGRVIGIEKTRFQIALSKKKEKAPSQGPFLVSLPPKEIVIVGKLRYFFFAGAFFAGFFAAFFVAIATSSVIQLISGAGQNLENP